MPSDFALSECTISVSSGQELERVKKSLELLLGENNLCSLATVTPSGSPHINVCFYGPTGDGQLILFTEPATRHGENLAQNPSAAVTVFDSHQKWGGDVYGVQGFGFAEILSGDVAETALSAYSAHHPAMKDWATSVDEIEEKFDSRLYAVALREFTLLDYATFGVESYVHGSLER
jgi:uncharacterized protein YhbP (UPF0306 family)